MKKLILAFSLLWGSQAALAQQITLVSPNRETDLPYFNFLNSLSYAGQIKIAVQGGQFAVDTAGINPNNPRVRFLIPSPYTMSGSGTWMSFYGPNSAPPYNAYMAYGQMPLITKVRVTHPDTLLVDYGSWYQDTWGLWVNGNRVPFSGLFDLEIRDTRGRRFYKDQAFDFDGAKEPVLFNEINRPSSVMTLTNLAGRAGQTLNVEISGTNTRFGQSSTTTMWPNELIVDFRNDTTLNTFNHMTVLSPTRMVASITIPASTPPGLYDIALMTPFDGIKHINNAFTVLPGVTNAPAHLKGRVFEDANRNCRLDYNERGIEGVTIQADPGGFVSVTDTAGFYDIAVPFGVYRLTRYSYSGWAQVCTGAVNDSIQVTQGAPTVDTLDYADYQQPFMDLAVTAASGIARPGFVLDYVARVENPGYRTGRTTLRFIPDTVPSHLSALPAPTSTRGDTLLWTLALPSRAGASVSIRMQVPAEVSLLGKTLSSRFELVNILTADSLPGNDTVSVKNLVSGSFDPNDKSVVPSGAITSQDSVLTYLIRFQNTGTDTAFTVVVRDTISTHLNLASLRTLIASHSYSFKVFDARMVEWRFDNIRLLDSNRNEERSHGFVKFSIKKRKEATVGTDITNQAHIYFDFNPPIATNLVHSTIVSVRRQESASRPAGKLEVMPNPVTGRARVVLPGMQAFGGAILTVKDATGRIVLRRMGLSGRELTFNARLKPGMYFVQVQENGDVLGSGRFVAE